MNYYRLLYFLLFFRLGCGPSHLFDRSSKSLSRSSMTCLTFGSSNRLRFPSIPVFDDEAMARSSLASSTSRNLERNFERKLFRTFLAISRLPFHDPRSETPHAHHARSDIPSRSPYHGLPTTVRHAHRVRSDQWLALLPPPESSSHRASTVPSGA